MQEANQCAPFRRGTAGTGAPARGTDREGLR